MDMKWVYAALTIALLAAAAFLCMLTAQRAGAGIGPAGFAYYAKQGINHGITQAYGSLRNSPYNVRCTEVPNYRTISDVVTCRITEKP